MFFFISFWSYIGIDLNGKAQHYDRALHIARENFYTTFFNNDFSVDIAQNSVILHGNTLHKVPEIIKRVSKLGFRSWLNFMLCRNFRK